MDTSSLPFSSEYNFLSSNSKTLTSPSKDTLLFLIRPPTCSADIMSSSIDALSIAEARSGISWLSYAWMRWYSPLAYRSRWRRRPHCPVRGRYYVCDFDTSKLCLKKYSVYAIDSSKAKRLDCTRQHRHLRQTLLYWQHFLFTQNQTYQEQEETSISIQYHIICILQRVHMKMIWNIHDAHCNEYIHHIYTYNTRPYLPQLSS